MDIEEEKETKKQALLPSLSKFWRTAYELPALYTGGKIIFAIKKKQVLCIANFAISVYDIEKKIYLPQIEHVFIQYLKLHIKYIRKMKS